MERYRKGENPESDLMMTLVFPPNLICILSLTLDIVLFHLESAIFPLIRLSNWKYQFCLYSLNLSAPYLSWCCSWKYSLLLSASENNVIVCLSFFQLKIFFLFPLFWNYSAWPLWSVFCLSNSVETVIVFLPFAVVFASHWKSDSHKEEISKMTISARLNIFSLTSFTRSFSKTTLSYW